MSRAEEETPDEFKLFSNNVSHFTSVDLGFFGFFFSFFFFLTFPNGVDPPDGDCQQLSSPYPRASLTLPQWLLMRSQPLLWP